MPASSGANACIVYKALTLCTKMYKAHDGTSLSNLHLLYQLTSHLSTLWFVHKDRVVTANVTFIVRAEEFRGDWSDRSELWEQNPRLKERLKVTDNKNDGRPSGLVVYTRR